MCHACTTERYFQAVVTETGSNCTQMDVSKSAPNNDGSETAHKAKECKSSNEAGRQLDSGMEKMSQKM